jgi:outer membrane protein
MNTISKICITSIVIFTMLTSAYIYTHKGKGKSVYILNDKVFADFEETKEVKKKLNAEEVSQKYILDSLFNEMQELEKRNQVVLAKQKKDIYDRFYEGFAQGNQKISMQYKESIWKHINQYLDEFGKENGYVFILGTSGDGNLMYADTTYNVTNEALLFINKKYAGE